MGFYQREPARLYRRVQPIKDERFRRAWAARHKSCAACGVSGQWRRLHVHHCVAFGRSDEPTNLLRLCWLCHNAAEGMTMCRPRPVPALTLAHCLALKQAADPEEFDPRRLAELLGEKLPEPDPVPAYYQGQVRNKRGTVPAEFVWGYSAEGGAA